MKEDSFDSFSPCPLFIDDSTVVFTTAMENHTQWLIDEIQCPETDHVGYQLNQSFEFWMEGVAQTIVAILGRILLRC